MTTLWPLEYVPAPELGRELARELEAASLVSTLGVDLERVLELDLDGLSRPARALVVERALGEAETVHRPPAPSEAADRVGPYDAGATDGRDADPRGWRRGEVAGGGGRR